MSFTSSSRASPRSTDQRSTTTFSAITSSGSTSLRRATNSSLSCDELFGFRPLALENSEHFHQRPKLDNYGDYVFLVFYGAWRHRETTPRRSGKSTCSSRASTSSRFTAIRYRAG